MRRADRCRFEWERSRYRRRRDGVLLMVRFTCPAGGYLLASDLIRRVGARANAEEIERHGMDTCERRD